VRGAAATALAVALTLAGAPAGGDVGAEPPPPCQGDACGDAPPPARAPLVVAGDARPPPPGPPGPPGPPPASTGRGHSNEAAGARLSFGRAFTRGISDGWYGRVDLETFELVGPGLFSHAGPGMIGIKLGLEGWGSVDGGGGGIPWGFEAGVALPFTSSPRSARVVLTGTVGWEWAFYDRIHHVGQVGIFAPLAEAHVGIDLRGVRILGDVSTQYRWGWGDADRAQLRAGVSLSFNSEL
jgi:hypothetical protein